MTERILDDETRYVLLRRLADNPGLSQRDLAKELGMSVGKINYCLRALLDKGYIKAGNFRNSKKKRAYLYHPGRYCRQEPGDHPFSGAQES